MSGDEGDDVDGNSAKRGWLNKQSKNEMSIMWGGGGAKWNKRFFVLAGGEFASEPFDLGERFVGVPDPADEAGVLGDAAA